MVTLMKTNREPVSMREVAAEAGVSVASVSYVLNGRHNQVGAKTLEKILLVTRRLNYQPNLLMRAVRTRRSQVIGVLIPSFRTTFFPTVADAIESELAAHGYHAVICQTHSQTECMERNLVMLRQRRVDGLIVTPKFDQANLFAELVERGSKVVLIDHSFPEIPIASVRSDDEAGAGMAVRHLLELGHRRIGVLRHQAGQFPEMLPERYRGYVKALAEAGIAIDQNLVETVETGFTAEDGENAFKRLYARCPDLTALFVPSDLAALGVMRAARELGLRIPEDLSLAGYHNQEAGSHTTPTLTTVDQKPAEIGHRAVVSLLGMIEGRNPPEPRQILIQPELIVRGSTGPLKTQ